MIKLRPADERGHSQLDWLDSRFTFSFADYLDPAHMGFRALRVINEDRIAAGKGFGTHAHADMEIITCVMEGELEHRDSMGNGAVLPPGEVQHMSAGSGITHSEFNPSPEHPVHLLQIWILPDKRGIKPEWSQKAFPFAERRGRLLLVASPDGAEGSLLVHQSVRLFLSLLKKDERVMYNMDGAWTTPVGLPPASFQFRNAWLQVMRGQLKFNGQTMAAGDGAAVGDEPMLEMVALADDTEFMLFDLA